MEWIKGIAGLAGVLTVILALAGIYLSIERNRIEEKRLSDAHRREQVNSSISLIADKNPAKQLAGITQLDSFFPTEDSRGQVQILALLSNVLAVEENKVVRDAIVASMRVKLAGKIGETVLRDSIRHMASVSTALVSKGRLDRSREGNEFGHLKADSIEARALSVAAIIELALRRSVAHKKLSGIYCVGCNFTDLDLDGVDFSNSVLYFADFSRASLRNAAFDAADLQETLFVGSDLRDAKFTFSKRPKSGKYRSSYADTFSEKETFSFNGPFYNCADLRNADFSGHPIFAIVHPSLDLYFTGGSFIGADLQGANLSNVKMFGKVPKNEHVPLSGGGGGSISKGVLSFEYEFSPYDSSIPESYHSNFVHLAKQFAGSNWREAKLPPGLKTWFKKNPPNKQMEFDFQAEPCVPATRDGFSPQLALGHRKYLVNQELIEALNSDGPEPLIRLVRWKNSMTLSIGEIDKTVLSFDLILGAIREQKLSILSGLLQLDDTEREHMSIFWPKEVNAIISEVEAAFRSFYSNNQSPGSDESKMKLKEIEKSLLDRDLLKELIKHEESINLAFRKFTKENYDQLHQHFLPYLRTESANASVVTD